MSWLECMFARTGMVSSWFIAVPSAKLNTLRVRWQATNIDWLSQLVVSRHFFKEVQVSYGLLTLGELSARRKVNRNPRILDSEKVCGVGNRLSLRYLRREKKISEAWKIRLKGTGVLELRVRSDGWSGAGNHWRGEMVALESQGNGKHKDVRLHSDPRHPTRSHINTTLSGLLWKPAKCLHAFQRPCTLWNESDGL